MNKRCWSDRNPKVYDTNVVIYTKQAYSFMSWIICTWEFNQSNFKFLLQIYHVIRRTFDTELISADQFWAAQSRSRTFKIYKSLKCSLII